MIEDPSDLTALRQQYPGWQITAHWLVAASGPDVRVLLAQRDGAVVVAYTPVALAEQIENAPGTSR